MKRTGSRSRQGLHLVKAKHACHNCDLRHLLRKTGIEEQQLPDAVCTIRCRGPYQPGDRIYRTGDPLSALYAITSGSVKTEYTTCTGALQVTGFYLRGDLFGAEALGEHSHSDDAIALETAWICELRTPELEDLCAKHPEVMRGLFQILNRRARNDTVHQVNVRKRTTEQRVLGFLQDFAERSRARLTGVEDEIPLPMTKEDMASYLAITPETLSRILRKLDDAGYIQTSVRTYRLLRTEPFPGVLDQDAG